MARPIKKLEITQEQKSQLCMTLKRLNAKQSEVRRARVVLLRADGKSQEDTAKAVGVRRTVVSLWENRFRKQGMAGLVDAPRSGRKSSIPTEVKAAIISEAVRPPAGRTQWSTRSMAKAKGVSGYTVGRIWQANGIKPHIKRTFKVSNDKAFEAKFWDVIGLYLNPPDKALVLCCDEKSQCQALERSQPGLPLRGGYVRTATHDYIRHGTVTLFAALNYMEGKIIRQTAARHTHKQWLGFLKQIDRETPEDLTLHIVLDNYSTHKHAKVRSWLKWRNQRQNKRHQAERFVLHFVPTSSSWMNLVERFFRDLTVDCVRDGSFTSVSELVASMEAYMAERDLSPKRYVWKAAGQSILKKIAAARAALNENCSV